MLCSIAARLRALQAQTSIRKKRNRGINGNTDPSFHVNFPKLSSNYVQKPFRPPSFFDVAEARIKAQARYGCAVLAMSLMMFCSKP